MPWSRYACVLVLAVCVLLGTFAPSALAASGVAGNPDPSLEQQLLAAVNADRAAQGLPNLVVDPKLTAVARQRDHSMLQSGVLSHCIGGGDSCSASQVALPVALRQLGIDVANAAENLALSDDQAEPAADLINGLWMGSDSHRPFILGQSFNTTGLGVICCGTVSVHGTVFTNAIIVTEIFAQYTPDVLAAVQPGLQGVAFVRVPSHDGCQFAMGFKTLYDLDPMDIGSCTDAETHDPVTGDGVQHTTRGILVWRKSYDQLAFTDGSQTWILGAHGLVHRRNSERFVWEPNPEGFPLAAGTT